MTKLIRNEQFDEALDLLENSSEHLFITGKAGAGKSTLINYFLEGCDENVVILAPTGIAALNVGGMTIHSFFKFPPSVTEADIISGKIKPYQRKIFKKIDTIIIDEISMVRADLLDCINQFLQKYGPRKGKIFGGVRMVFVGDLFQLPPVVKKNEEEIFRLKYPTPFFFSANAIKNTNITTIDLINVYRQKDSKFLDILNTIREGKRDNNLLATLNSRLINVASDEGYIYLTTTNKQAERINSDKLATVEGKSYKISAEISGKVNKDFFPTADELILKRGAQVIFTINTADYKNGSIGRVAKISEKQDGSYIITVGLEDGRYIDVEQHIWEINRFVLNEDDEIETETVGKFKQIPLKLAWAITVHKSQGQTYDKIVLDMNGGAFACGQLYVALSRCTSLEGVILKKPITANDIIVDGNIVQFTNLGNSDNYKTLREIEEIFSNAIESDEEIEILYNRNNESLNMRIKPIEIGEFTYKTYTYYGAKVVYNTRVINLNLSKVLQIL